MSPSPETSVHSSPDPLGNSALADAPLPSPTKSPVRQTPLNKTTTPIKSSTNNIKLQDFILKTPPAGLLRSGQSPTKSTAKTENLLSPWRIRVTVEAERDKDKQGAGDRASGRVGRSLSKSGTGRTTTTLVPLKGLEDSSPTPARRRNARSKKVDVGSSPMNKGGAAALVRKRGRRLTSDEDDVGRDTSVGATPGKRGPKRLRKSLSVVNEDVVMAEAGRVTPIATPLAKNARGKRKATSPVNIASNEDLDGDVFSRRSTRVVRNASVALAKISPNRSSPGSPRHVLSAAHSNPTDVAMLANPTNEHREFDSILESEGFSMISLESIESARQNLSSITDRTGGPSMVVATEEEVPTKANDTGYPKLPTPDDTDDYATRGSPTVESSDGDLSPAEVAKPQRPPTRDSEADNITTDSYLEAYLRIIRNAPPKPTAPLPPQPTTWLGKLTSMASLLQSALERADSWSNAEYRLLDTLYQRAKVDATICPYNPKGGIWGFRLCLGHTLYYGKNYSLKITKSHLGIVDAFREVVRGASLRNGGDGSVEWSEFYVVQRLFSVMVAEDMRARGIPFPQQKGESGQGKAEMTGEERVGVK